MTRILVAGGAGFIGSFLCERLVQDGHSVICLDNFHTSSRSNIQHLVKHKAFQLVVHDVEEPVEIEAEQIFNLACPASPVHYQRDPVKTLKSCVLGSIHLLELAARSKARYLVTSTSEVYGDPEEHPQRETYWGHVNPIGPRACYDEGKRVSETFTMDYHRQYGVDVRIARLFNTFGPHMQAHDGRVVSNFIVSALRNEPLRIDGDGSQTRAFCYVTDIVDGLVRLMNSDGDTGPFNLGRPGEMTILQLAQLILQLTGSGSIIEHVPFRTDDPFRRDPDIAKARAQLGWSPTVSIRDGLKMTIDYFRGLAGDSAPGASRSATR